jgi:hypothetical protein
VLAQASSPDNTAQVPDAGGDGGVFFAEVRVKVIDLDGQKAPVVAQWR